MMTPEQFRQNLLNPIKQRLWMLTRLPSAWFMGVKVASLSAEGCTVTVKYGWRSRNPFNSIYFATQMAAAEMSTGALALMSLQGKGDIAILLVDAQGSFSKKASSKALFTCTEAHLAAEAIQKAIDTGAGQTVTLTSVGRLESGEEIGRFKFTWSFKVRSRK